MGVLSFMTGMPTNKADEGGDFYEAFAQGQIATHKVLRRTIHSLSDGPTLQVNAATDDEKAGWLQYVTLTIEFLQVHHAQEDRFVFPAARRVSNNPHLLAGEENEHKIVDDLVKWWYKVAKNGFLPTERLTQALVGETRRHFAALQWVMCAMGGHLGREALTLTAGFWRRSSMTEGELMDLNDDMHRVIPLYMKKGSALAFFVMNLNDDEKRFFDERVSYPVRKWFFPTYCEEIKKALPFCAFPRFEGPWLPATTDGHKRFGVNRDPRWSGHVRQSWFVAHTPKSAPSLIMLPSPMQSGYHTMSYPMMQSV